LANSPRRPHGFFTTFTTLEEKLLLRVRACVRACVRVWALRPLLPLPIVL
jgi:hypothetical protein